MKTVLPSYLHILHFYALCTWEQAVSLLLVGERIFCPKTVLLHAQSSILYPLTCCAPHPPLCAHCAVANQLLERFWRILSSAPPPWYTIIHLPTFIFCNEWQTSHKPSLPCFLENWSYKRKTTLIAAVMSCHWIQPFFPFTLYSSIYLSFFHPSLLLLAMANKVGTK